MFPLTITHRLRRSIRRRLNLKLKIGTKPQINKYMDSTGPLYYYYYHIILVFLSWLIPVHCPDPQSVVHSSCCPLLLLSTPPVVHSSCCPLRLLSTPPVAAHSSLCPLSILGQVIPIISNIKTTL